MNSTFALGKSFLVIVSIGCLLASCSSALDYKSPFLEDKNLKGNITKVTETYFNIEYINKEIIKRNVERSITYVYNGQGILISQTYSSPENGVYREEKTTIIGDTLITDIYQWGELEDNIDYIILNGNKQKIEEYSINRISGKKENWKKYTYKHGKIDRRYDSMYSSSFIQYVYDENGFLVSLDVYDEDAKYSFTSYKYENDEKGRHIKTSVRLGAGSHYRENLIIQRYNENGDEVYNKFNNWWEYKYKYAYDRHGNWITSLRKNDDSYEYIEREIEYN